jgi:biotin carboxylase
VPSSANRLLLLLPTTTYRTEAFVEAATKLGVELVCASERPSTLEHLAPDALVTLDFADPRASAETVARFAARRPIDAVVPVDDLTTVVAAAISQRLGLKANSLPAVALARNKHAMRRCLAAAGVPVPRFRLVPLADDPAARAAEVEYPCVLKPLALSASRGVIRANDSREFVAAFHRIAAILESVKAPLPDEARQALLAEEFIPGREVALEGLLIGGTLHVLAIFDKPDPLDGPFFEETIYVTPSRLAEPVQARLAAVTRDACSALGLTEGPIHAELRLNERGPFVLEVAARSIGGLCSRTLTFGTGLSLEELILCHALGRPLESLERERRAAGVMMVPIPRAGRLASVHGAAEAAAVDGVEEVAITMHPGQEVVPLPEGWQYLGFIFARAETPVAVEHALRQAHARLHFTIE